MIELFRELVFKMFLDGNLPELDMDDYQIMWKVIMDKWEIKVVNGTFEEFIDDINCKATECKEKFDYIFDSYFIKE